MKKMYDYLFYKLYKLFEEEQFHWMREWRVFAILCILDWMLYFSLFLYYSISIDNSLSTQFESLRILDYIIIIIAGLNYFHFFYKDQWKKVVKEFEKYPRRNNKIGTFIVYSVIILIILNLIISIFLYYQT